MSRAWTIARRELSSYFSTPVGFVVVALYLFISAFIFSEAVFKPGMAASMRAFFDFSVFLLLFIVPAISMRLLADEHRQGTLETLITCPVSDLQVVLGKWLGAMLFFLGMLAPTLLFVILLEIYADPDYGPIICGYLGLILLGGLYMAFGLLASSFSESQILAYLLSLFFWLSFLGLTNFIPQQIPDPWSDAFFWMSVDRHYRESFALGLIDTSSIVYLVSAIVLFLTATVKVLESRRWR